MPIPQAIEARRLVGKLVLLVAGVWAMGALAFLAAGVQGSRPPLLNLMIYIATGAALIPGAYYAIRLHLTTERDAVDRLLRRAIGYGVAGIAIFTVGFFLMLQPGGGS